jgi:hypothetical protein
MPREMDPPPKKEPERKKLVAHEVLKGVSEEPSRATFAEYQAMMADRPEKFGSEEVNYRKCEDVGNECEHCAHYYQQVAGDKRATCEIFRPDGDESVEAEWVCDFFSRDLVEYPYQESSSQSEGEEEEEVS